MDPSTMEEPSSDNEFTRELWFEEVPNDPDFLKEIKERVEKWKKTISITTDPDKLIIHQVGESHIDVAWKWRYAQTRQKAIHTFRKACFHAKHFKDSKYDFCFALSEPLLLDWVQQDDPDLFEEIKEVVKMGGIELVGGSYVEPDCMMPSGEAFCRMRLYGQRFYRKHFGQLAEVEWFLDSFGYNYGLPQILVKSGATAFWTSKITWNRQTLFPFVNFWWQGPDGSKILTANFKMGLSSITDWIMWEMGRHPLTNDGQKVWDYTHDYGEIDEHVDLEEIVPHCGSFFGKGDGGHGPTHQEVAEANAYQDVGFTKWSKVGDFYDGLREWQDRLPVWNDELYLEYHRGTFSVHAEVKRHNRLYENAITGLETLGLITSLSNASYDYPFDKIEKLWKITLLNQFHDVLPGSSIPEVYDDVYDYWMEQDGIIDGIKQEVGETIVENDEENSQYSLILFNPVSWVRDGPVFIPVNAIKGDISLDENGVPPIGKLSLLNGTEESFIAQPIAAEAENEAYPRPAGWWVLPKLPGLSTVPAILSLNASHDAADVSHTVKASEEMIENEVVSIKLDQKTGAMIEMKAGDINGGKNLLRGDQSNLNFGFLDDFPHDHAWNIKPEYWKYPLEDIQNDEDVSITVLESGPVFSTIAISRSLGKEKNKVIQKLTLFKNRPEVYMHWITDWKQPFVMIKVLYQTATNAEESVSDAAYCAIRRKTQPDTPCDEARYEKIMHKYVDLSTPDNRWGFALINEGKYAYDTMNDPGDLRLTMLRVPRYPEPAGEAWVNKERKENREKYDHEVPEFVGLGAEKCRYMLLPHNGGSLENTDGSPNVAVKRAAEEFNQPVMVIPSEFSAIEEDTIGSKGESLVQIHTDNVFLGALKYNEWEKNGNLILRMIEGCGIDAGAKISLHPSLTEIIADIRAVDILERPIDYDFNYDQESGTLTFDIGKFEIVTFALSK